MNFFKRTALLATLGLATFGVSSCERFTKDYDVNPNAPQDAPAAQQLRATEIAEGYVFAGNLARVAGMWSGYFSGVDRQYSSLDQYITSAGDYDNEWGLAFEATAAQARIVTNKALAVNNFQLAGIAQVMEANMIGTCTALWGDIPYSENFRVQSVSDPRSPKFDTQQQVYTQVNALLTTAIVNLGKTGLSPDGRDIFYGGDTDKWTAAAHSLRARYLLHALGNINKPGVTQQQLQEIITEAQAGISDPANNLLMPFYGTAPGGDFNPYYDFIDYSRSGYMTADGAFATMLLDTAGTSMTRANAKTDEAGRFAYFYTFGGDYGAPDPNYIDGAFAVDASHPLMTAVETKLIIAECEARQNNAAAALTALNEVRALNAARFSGGKYDAYVNTDFGAGGIVNPSLSQADALLKEILTEKYLSLVGQIETFNDLRRTNNLVGVPKKSAAAPDLPQRFLIAQSEVNTNTNTPKPIPTLYQKTPVNR
ncbi:MAG: SusD/RagB family nutrient-binding outer membrane lipoprotein [Hymenobacteraceae bacterium]|nr:SusD/RagB family nutrient-binding outer membrane lipoprotein [Hymenobacteraceae bacterium]